MKPKSFELDENELTVLKKMKNFDYKAGYSTLRSRRKTYCWLWRLQQTSARRVTTKTGRRKPDRNAILVPNSYGRRKPIQHHTSSENAWQRNVEYSSCGLILKAVGLPSEQAIKHLNEFLTLRRGQHVWKGRDFALWKSSSYLYISPKLSIIRQRMSFPACQLHMDVQNSLMTIYRWSALFN